MTNGSRSPSRAFIVSFIEDFTPNLTVPKYFEPHLLSCPALMLDTVRTCLLIQSKRTVRIEIQYWKS